MRTLRLLGAALAVAASTSQIALAQRGGGAGNTPAQNAAATNPQAELAYGAPSKDPVSKWTPPASAGRPLTLNDHTNWKGIRGSAIYTDGRGFV